MLQNMDVNQNGALEKDEMPERMQARFDQLDTDGNGQLDRPEIGAMLRQIMQRAGQMPRDGMPPGDDAMRPGDGKRPGGEAGKRRGQNQPPRMRDQQEMPESGSVEPVRPPRKKG